MLKRTQITDQIAESMRAGTPPWRKTTAGLPTNAFTSKAYTGMNVMVLDLASVRYGYTSKYWATYKQWVWLGCTVKKRPDTVAEGQWAVSLTRWEDNKPKTALVFNAAQVFGIDAAKWKTPAQAKPDYEHVENVIAATKAVFRWGYDEPKYRRPPHDYICMPMPSRFVDKRQLFASKLHELVHWSEWRTGWKGTYEQGELIAEIATGILESELGIPHCGDMTNHEKYLPVWLKEMAAEPKYFSEAATQASKAVDFILKRV